jgi:hypothetical protein
MMKTIRTACSIGPEWTGPNYAVAYTIGSSPFGPFTRIGKILEQDPTVAAGAGHHR